MTKSAVKVLEYNTERYGHYQGVKKVQEDRQPVGDARTPLTTRFSKNALDSNQVQRPQKPSMVKSKLAESPDIYQGPQQSHRKNQNSAAKHAKAFRTGKVQDFDMLKKRPRSPFRHHHGSPSRQLQGSVMGNSYSQDRLINPSSPGPSKRPSYQMPLDSQLPNYSTENYQSSLALSQPQRMIPLKSIKPSKHSPINKLKTIGGDSLVTQKELVPLDYKLQQRNMDEVSKDYAIKMKNAAS